MKNTILFVLCALSIVTAGLASGTPVLYPKWPSIKLINKHRVSLLRDDANEKLIWVKPPSVGAAIRPKTPISDHPNHDRCNELSQSLKDVLESVNEFDKALEEIYEYRNDLVNSHHRLSLALEAEANTIETALEKNIARIIASTTKKYVEAEIEHTDIVHRVDSCHKTCKPLFTRKLELENEIKSLQRRIDDYEDTHKHLAEALFQDALKILSEKRNVYNLERTISEIAHHLAMAERRLFKEYSKKAQLPAGHQEVTYRLKWNKVIAELAKDNPNFRFKPIPVRSLRLRSRLVPEKVDDFYLSTLPTFLKFESQSVDLARPGQVENTDDFISNSISEIKGTFYYSLAGACPLTSASYFSLIEDKILKDKSQNPKYNAVLTYSYLVSLRHPAGARYNPYQVYKAILSAKDDSNYISRSELLKWIDEGLFMNAIVLPKTYSAKESMDIVSEIATRVLVAVSTPQSFPGPNRGFSTFSMAPNCQSYHCKVSGWDLFSGDRKIDSENTLRSDHNFWHELDIGKDGLITLTDITMFELEEGISAPHE